MAADPRDDFSVIDEPYLFGLPDPYAVIRAEVARSLEHSTPDLELERIECLPDPKWLTVARRDAGLELTVSGFGMCVPATLTFGAGYASEQARATITVLCLRWDEPRREVIQTFVDLGGDAARGYTDAVFRERLDAFRADLI